MNNKMKKVPNNQEFSYMPDHSLEDHSETIYMDELGNGVSEEEATHAIRRIYDKNGELLREEFIFIDRTMKDTSEEDFKWPSL